MITDGRESRPPYRYYIVGPALQRMGYTVISKVKLFFDGGAVLELRNFRGSAEFVHIHRLLTEKRREFLAAFTWAFFIFNVCGVVYKGV